MVLASELHMVIVLANMEANTSPTIPVGRNVLVSVAYNVASAAFCVSPGNNNGPQNIGKKRMKGHIMYNPAENNAAFFASFPSEVDMNLAARFQVPPL